VRAAAAEPPARTLGRGALLGLALALVVYALLAWRFAWLCDDAFISFRYADNWVAGRGLRFNPGESPPVEGYSNFLWVALGALVELLGGEQTRCMPWISALCGAGLLVALAVALRRGLGLGGGATSLALVTLAASVPFAGWGTGGLETMLFASLFFLLFSLLVLEPTGVPVLSAGLVGLGLALVRVEGTFWALGLGVLGWLARRWRGEREGWAVVGTLAIVAAGAWAWWIARYLYYGEAWPNPVYVKVAFSRETLAVGGRYVATFALTWLTPFFVLLALPSALAPGRRKLALPALACLLALWSYAVVVGGDFMALGRLLVPGLAFQALLFGCLAADLARRPATRWLAPVLAGAHATLGLAAGYGHELVPRAALAKLHFRGNSEEYRGELEQWRYMRDNTAERTTLARLLAEATAPGESLVRGAIGVVGYYTELVILDTFGLVAPEVARRLETSEDHSPGHAKRVEPEFFLEREPTYLVARAFPVPAEEQARRDLARQVRRLAKRWEEDYAGLPYAPELTRHRDPGGGPTEQLLVLVRRVAPDEVGASWSRFDADLRELD